MSRIEQALSQLVEHLVPAYPDEDEQVVEDRLDEAYDHAKHMVDEAKEIPVSDDVQHVADMITRKLINVNTTPEKVLQFRNLYNRLLAEPVLKNKHPVLYLLHLLSDSVMSTRSHQPPIDDQINARQDFVVDSHAFNEAFSTAGLPRLAASTPAREVFNERPISRHRDKRERQKGRSVNGESSMASPAFHSHLKYESVQPNEASLLRDIPFVLQGLSSTNLIFNSSNSLQLPKSLPVPVIGVLHTLAEPCLLYKFLTEFVESESGGLVGQSFRFALGVELRSYLKLVAALEGQIRRALNQLDDTEPRRGIGKAGVTLKRCVHWTREATMGLRLMSLMVEESRNNKGGQLISVVHSYSLRHGDPFVSSFAERMLKHILDPFYDMLKHWINDGELSDPYLEFFVVEQKELSDDRGVATSVWEDKYKLVTSAIPSIITEQFAKKVFLIGKSLNFIRHGCNDASWVENYSKSASTELKYGDTATLESSIDEAYKTTMTRLIELMETKFHLFDHLTALKRYLLLGAGDFITILMESLSDTLDGPANSQYRHNLTAKLEEAIRNSNVQHESADVLRRLDCRMLELSHGEIGWEVFTLEYKISPPIDVIVTPYASKQYLKVFNFLWRIKRVQFALTSTWNRCITGSRGVLGAVQEIFGADFKRANTSIAEMIHFISQLQYYILFEVIERSWTALVAACRRPGCTLDDLIAAHADYLSAITHKGLLAITSADFPAQLHELVKIMLAYRDAVSALYASAVAEFTRQSDQAAKIEARTKAGKWGVSENEGKSGASLIPGMRGMGEAEELTMQRERLRELSDKFKRRITRLLEDLITQGDSDIRWLAMVMNFNDVYQPRRRKRGPVTSQTPATNATSLAGGTNVTEKMTLRAREAARKEAGGK